MSSPPPTWFITGVSNGLGLLLTLRALRAGHRVYGSLRNKERNADAVRQIEAAGGQVVEMDMTESQESIHDKVRAVGPIDFLVNNAAYSIFSTVEQLSEKDVTGIMSANVFGPVYTIQAALQTMRPARKGVIVNISSVAALDPLPASAIYAASKAAVEAMTVALEKEVEPLGIKLLIIEPGSLRTNFMRAIQTCEKPMEEDYKGSYAARLIENFRGYDGRQPNDPAKAADRIFEIATGQGMAGELSGKVLRLVLGEDALHGCQKGSERLVNDLTLGKKVSCSINFDS